MNRIIEGILLGLQNRRAQRELAELDEYLLRDIGLTRHEIRRVTAAKNSSRAG